MLSIIHLTQSQISTLNNTGVYVENMGILHQSTKNWNLLIHLNESVFDEDIAIVNEESTLLQQLCYKMNILHLNHCNESMIALNTDLNNVKKSLKLVKEFLSKLEIRSKRALVNAVGKLQKYLFGTMDENDEQNIHNAFESIQNNEDKIVHVVENQMSLLKHFTDKLNSTDLKLNKNFILVSESLSEMSNQISDLSNKTNTIFMFEQILDIVNVKIQHLQKELSEVLGVIRKSKHGMLHYSILYSEAFGNSIKEIQTKLPNTLKLPFKTSKLDLQSINPLIKIIPTYINNKLILSVLLPLITESFDLFKLTSIPQPYKDNLFYYVKLDTDYIAVNDVSRTVLFLSSKNIKSCIKNEMSEYLCNENFVHYNKNINNCILFLIKGETFHDTCEVHISKLTHELWYHTIQTNKWLYVIPTPTNIKINCPQGTTIQKIFGTGLLTLARRCKAFTNEISLFSKDKVVNQSSIILEYNEQIPKITIPINTIIPKVKIQHFEEFNLDANSKNIKTIINIDKFTFDSNHLSLTLIIIIIFLVFAIFICYKKYLKIKCTRNNDEQQAQNE